MASKLSLADRSKLQAAVGVPTYRRDQISSGVVHIGVGSFHRAYQAAYLDDLFNRGRARLEASSVQEFDHRTPRGNQMRWSCH